VAEAQGGKAQGGKAQGGKAQGGKAQGGKAQGGKAQGDTASRAGGACRFCLIASRSAPGELVLEEEDTVAFLDSRPLFPGHVLVIPRDHVETLLELPAELLAHLFGAAQRLARALTTAVGAEGSFVAVNNVVSQSVAHLHVHVVPRRRGDGLRGFFWPRQGYTDSTDMARTGRAIRAALAADEATR
jgi:histidine triad (HIT) family protein